MTDSCVFHVIFSIRKSPEGIRVPASKSNSSWSSALEQKDPPCLTENLIVPLRYLEDPMVNLIGRQSRGWSEASIQVLRLSQFWCLSSASWSGRRYSFLQRWHCRCSWEPGVPTGVPSACSDPGQNPGKAWYLLLKHWAHHIPQGWSYSEDILDLLPWHAGHSCGCGHKPLISCAENTVGLLIQTVVAELSKHSGHL